MRINDAQTEKQIYTIIHFMLSFRYGEADIKLELHVI